MKLIKQNAFDLGNPSFFDISGWSLQNPNFVATCGTIKNPEKGMDDEKGGNSLKTKTVSSFQPGTLTLEPKFELAGVAAFAAVNRFRQTNFRHLQNARKQSRKMNQQSSISTSFTKIGAGRSHQPLLFFCFLIKWKWNQLHHQSLTKSSNSSTLSL
jgi:hypothetical protein